MSSAAVMIGPLRANRLLASTNSTLASHAFRFIECQTKGPSFKFGLPCDRLQINVLSEEWVVRLTDYKLSGNFGSLSSLGFNPCHAE